MYACLFSTIELKKYFQLPQVNLSVFECVECPWKSFGFCKVNSASQTDAGHLKAVDQLCSSMIILFIIILFMIIFYLKVYIFCSIRELLT